MIDNFPTNIPPAPVTWSAWDLLSVGSAVRSSRPRLARPSTRPVTVALVTRSWLARFPGVIPGVAFAANKAANSPSDRSCCASNVAQAASIWRVVVSIDITSRAGSPPPVSDNIKSCFASTKFFIRHHTISRLIDGLGGQLNVEENAEQVRECHSNIVRSTVRTLTKSMTTDGASARTVILHPMPAPAPTQFRNMAKLRTSGQDPPAICREKTSRFDHAAGPFDAFEGRNHPR